MYMSTLVQKDIIRLDVSMNDSLLVTIPEGASQFGDPETHGILGERLARDVKSKIASVHEIHNDIAVLKVSGIPVSLSPPMRTMRR